MSLRYIGATSRGILSGALRMGSNEECMTSTWSVQGSKRRKLSRGIAACCFTSFTSNLGAFAMSGAIQKVGFTSLFTKASPSIGALRDSNALDCCCSCLR